MSKDSIAIILLLLSQDTSKTILYSRKRQYATRECGFEKSELIDGYTIKYHANGRSKWSKGKIINGKADGYWEWYRLDGTLKRSGYFSIGEAVGKWTTYDSNGEVYKVTNRT